MPQALIYECPHCGATVEVAEDRLQETAICPNPECRRPFRLTAPLGKFVGRTDGSAPQQARYKLGDGESEAPQTLQDERTLEVVHPAMFRRHPFRFLGIALLVLAGLVGAVTLFASGQHVPAVVGLIAAGAGLVLFGLWWLRVLNVTLTITTKRSVLRRGIVSKETSEVRHDDVRNLQVEQSFVERLLSVGDIAVSSAGQDEIEIAVEGVRDPERILDIIRRHQE